MLVAVLLAFAVATTTVTLCKAKVTQPLRDLLFRSAFLEALLSCLYCTSHWVAGGFAVLAPDLGLGAGSFVNWLVATLFMVAASAPVMWVINRSHGTMVWGPH